MKLSTHFPACFVAISLLSGAQLFAQGQVGPTKGPTSKLYLSETKGTGRIYTDGKVFEPKQATAFDAPGTIIETEANSHQAYVYSNGSAMYVDANSRIEVNRFVQERFTPNSNTTEAEPSVSQSDIFLWRGLVGICTSQLVSGTTMNYATELATVNIRGRKIAINATPAETIVYLIDGDVTVRTGRGDSGGQVLKTGERAVIRPGAAGGPPTITIDQIDRQFLNELDEKVTVACNARRTVSFETIEKSAEFGAAGPDGAPGEEIVPVPVIPQTPPVNITVSPDRI
jgi:FecR protein